jgi:succinate dehydrogenase/fumarate reductase flavoprotein subunit
VSGNLERHFGHAVLLCTGGYGNVFYLSTNAMGSNVTAAWKAHKKGAFLPILVLHKFTQLVFQLVEIIKVN